MQMALIFLHHVTLTVVFCSMTSHATEVSFTYKVQVNSTGGKVCAVDKPSTVIPMAVRAMRIQCGGKCNEAPSCKLFQLNEDLKQCELFNYLPSNFAPIDHCTAYMSSRDIIIEPSTMKPVTTQVVPMSPRLVRAWTFSSNVMATALLNDQLLFTQYGYAEVKVANLTTLATTLRSFTFSTLGTLLYSLATSAVDNCLYISDYINQLVHRVNLPVTSTVSVVSWTVSSRPWGVSVTSENNVLVACHDGNVTEYTPGGLIFHTVIVSPVPFHVVEVDRNTWAFIDSGSPGQVCTALKNGTVIKCLGSVGGYLGAIAIDTRGYMVISDYARNTIQLVDPTLTSSSRIQLPSGSSEPRGVSYDQSKGRLCFGDSFGLQRRDFILDGVWW